MCVCVCVEEELCLLRQRPGERRQRESNSLAFHTPVCPPISHGAGGWEAGGFATWLLSSLLFLGHLFALPPRSFSQATALLFNILAQAAQGRSQASPVCQGGGPHLRAPLAICLDPLAAHGFSGQGLSPTPCPVGSLQCPRERGTQTALGSALPGL